MLAHRLRLLERELRLQPRREGRGDEGRGGTSIQSLSRSNPTERAEADLEANFYPGADGYHPAESICPAWTAGDPEEEEAAWDYPSDAQCPLPAPPPSASLYFSGMVLVQCRASAEGRHTVPSSYPQLDGRGGDRLGSS